MKFTAPLLRGRLVKRYKRFLADVVLDSGETVTTTCPNTGSMIGLLTPGAVVWLSESDSPTRKYKHTWELVEAQFGEHREVVGINTNHPNKLVTEAIEAGRIKELKGYDNLRREVKYGRNSRIDILLEDETKAPCYVEIKNVHMMRTLGRAEFPDSVTERGAKHLAEMSDMVAAGHRAVMLYLIQMSSPTLFELARDIDPTYALAFEKARAAGVEAIAYRCRVTPEEIAVDKAVKMKV
ncbi:MAG: DNA/RNA nuclease SfsA [Hyphomicrobiaceae bacterium]